MVSYLADTEAVLTGDTLFVDSAGRTELQFGAGDAALGAHLLHQSIHGTLLSQPGETAILSGYFAIGSGSASTIEHGVPVSTTVGAARTSLSLLQRVEETLVEEITGSFPEQPADYEVVIAIDSRKTSRRPLPSRRVPATVLRRATEPSTAVNPNQ